MELFVMLFDVVFTFESEDKILKGQAMLFNQAVLQNDFNLGVFLCFEFMAIFQFLKF